MLWSVLQFSFMICSLESLWSFDKFTHFDDELTHIEGSKLREAGFTEGEVRDMIQSMEKRAKATGDPFIVVPYMRRQVIRLCLGAKKKSWRHSNSELQSYTVRI